MESYRDTTNMDIDDGRYKASVVNPTSKFFVRLGLVVTVVCKKQLSLMLLILKVLFWFSLYFEQSKQHFFFFFLNMVQNVIRLRQSQLF